MKMKDFKNALLVAMLRYQRRVGLSNMFEPLNAAESEGLGFLPGQIGLCCKEFEKKGLIDASWFLGGGEDGGIHCSLTAAGFEKAEELEQIIPELTRSNRYIRLADHQKEIEALREKVKELESLVIENRDNTFEEKEGTLAELAALEMILSQPLISVPLAEKIINETVFFLARKFVDHAIGIAAGALLTIAVSALGIQVLH